MTRLTINLKYGTSKGELVPCSACGAYTSTYLYGEKSEAKLPICPSCILELDDIRYHGTKRCNLVKREWFLSPVVIVWMRYAPNVVVALQTLRIGMHNGDNRNDRVGL